MTPQVSTCPECRQPMTPEYGALALGGPFGGIWVCANGHPRIERMRDDAGELMQKPPRGESVRVPVPDATRADLIAAIAMMPEEAFGYLLRAPLMDFRELATNGGFRPESRASFQQVAAAADAYVNRRT